MVCRMLKAVVRVKPSLPKYQTVWDIGLLVKHLRVMGDSLYVNRKTLSVKVLALLQATTAARLSTLHAIKLSDLKWSGGHLVIHLLY